MTLQTIQIIDYASVSVTLFFLGVGSVFDLKRREVCDKVWLIYGPIGLILTISRLLVDQTSLIITTASIGITALVSLALFYFGLFGGADAKGIICLGITLPLIPNIHQPLISYLHPFFPIVVVVVSYVCSVSVALLLGLRNLFTLSSEGAQIFDGLSHEPTWKKALAFITGYPSTVSKLNSTFYLYPMEEVVEDMTGARRKFQFFFSAEADRNALVSRFIESLEKVGSPKSVWVSPGLPMLLFIFIGFIITFIVGDPVFSTVLILSAR